MLWCSGDQCPDNNHRLCLIYCTLCTGILVLVLQHCSSELLPGCAWGGSLWAPPCQPFHLYIFISNCLKSCLKVDWRDSVDQKCLCWKHCRCDFKNEKMSELNRHWNKHLTPWMFCVSRIYSASFGRNSCISGSVHILLLFCAASNCFFQFCKT